MGTRNLILVYYKGQYVIAQYCAWDGYPSDQGVETLAFVSDASKVEKLKRVIDADLLYEPHEFQLRSWEAEAETLEDDYNERVRSSTADEGSANPEAFRRPMELVCPSMSAGTGARILRYAAGAKAPFPIVKEMSFSDDLEWAYVVDLDKALLEVYGRYHEREDAFASDRFGSEGCPIAGWPPGPCVGKWSLGTLPDKEEFVKKCDGE